MKPIDWNAEAARAADHVTCTELFKAHRGAIPWGNLGVVVVFGNDSYTKDERARREVEFVREFLRTEGLTELGFGVDSDEGYSWAMIVDTNFTPPLFYAVWEAWGRASGADMQDAVTVSQTGIALMACMNAGPLDPSRHPSAN